MISFRKNRFFILTILFMALSAQSVFAEETIKSKYFNISLYDGIDKVGLLNKLNASYFLRISATFSGKEPVDSQNTNAMIGKTLDSMYLEVCDIMDIHMYSFTIELDIVPDKGRMSELLKNYINRTIDMSSFYLYDKNRIYISYADITAGMLAHEIAHAITSHYFVVPPPEKLQEVLSGYVEFSIRKHTKKN